MKKFTFYFLWIFVFGACTEPDCIDQGGEFISISFRDITTGNIAPIRVNQLTVAGLPDTLIFNAEGVEVVNLPINPGDTTISAYFDTELGIDTLTIGYDQTVGLISEDCGIEIIYTGIRIEKNNFDSAQVVNSKVQLNFLDGGSQGENIRIFN